LTWAADRRIIQPLKHGMNEEHKMTAKEKAKIAAWEKYMLVSENNKVYNADVVAAYKAYLDACYAYDNEIIYY
jgi:hypothetical protein